jgi:CRISPR system Cascade subunit CasE
MNLHLTRALVPYEITARRWKDGGFTDSYAWHKRVWECFPDRPADARDFLTRLDDTGGGFRLLILSASAPGKPAWCPDDSWNTAVLGDEFLAHSRYRFSLLANPTKKIRSNGKGELLKNSRRVPLSKREDLLNWLTRKAALHGFAVDPEEIRTIPRPRQPFVKAGTAGLHTATEFVGTLKVTEPELFHHAIQHGIGSAKAFGFGMLCLSPV